MLYSTKCYEKKSRVNFYWGGQQVAILNRMVKVGLNETVTFKQRLGGG